MSVSVVIPALEGRHVLLARAIDSVLEQGDLSAEIIVVDDGATDATRVVAEGYGARVRYLRHENRGYAAACNGGLEAATGEYVAFLQSDDRWLPFKASIQVAVLERHPEIGLCFSDFVIEKPDGRVLGKGASRWAGHPLDWREMAVLALQPPAEGPTVDWPEPRVRYYIGSMYRQLLDELPISTSTVVIRRSALEAHMRFSTIRTCEDWGLFALVAQRAPLAYVDLATTIHGGQSDATRASQGDALTRARGYVELVNGVWAGDEQFVASCRRDLRRAQAHAWLAVAEAALASGQVAEASRALVHWQAIDGHDRAGLARFCWLCTHIPGGRMVLKSTQIARVFVQHMFGSADAAHSIDPAA